MDGGFEARIIVWASDLDLNKEYNENGCGSPSLPRSGVIVHTYYLIGVKPESALYRITDITLNVVNNYWPCILKEDQDRFTDITPNYVNT